MNNLVRLSRDLNIALEAGIPGMPPRITAALVEAIKSPQLVPNGYRLANSATYARHLLYSDPRGRYCVMSLVWRPGQCSPVHGHYTWCAFAVLEGQLEETLYEYSRREQYARPIETYRRQKGASYFAYPGLDEVHQIRNASSQTALSLHVYGVEALHVASGVNRTVKALS